MQIHVYASFEKKAHKGLEANLVKHFSMTYSAAQTPWIALITIALSRDFDWKYPLREHHLWTNNDSKRKFFVIR